MQRFFFNIRSGQDYVSDDHGEECPTLQVAGSMAIEGAKELMAQLESTSRSPQRTCFEITDEKGRLRLRIPFTLAMHPRNNSPYRAGAQEHVEQERFSTSRGSHG
jgi:hypothetical protein